MLTNQMAHKLLHLVNSDQWKVMEEYLKKGTAPNNSGVGESPIGPGNVSMPGEMEFAGQTTEPTPAG